MNQPGAPEKQPKCGQHWLRPDKAKGYGLWYFPEVCLLLLRGWGVRGHRHSAALLARENKEDYTVLEG